MKKALLYLFGSLLAISGWAQKYNSLFWEVSGNGLKESSYLYGTMHAQDERVFQFKEGVMPAFKVCKAYAMELNMDSIDQGKVMQQLVMDSTHTLETLLSEEDYAKLDAFFKDSLQQPLFMYNKMQPMFVASLMSQRKLKKQMEQALDLHFHTLAKEQEKKVIGLEKMEEQVGAFKSIPYEEQATMLTEALNNVDSADMSMDEMINWYVEGNLDELLKLTEEQEGSDKFVEVFLTSRNHRMADRAVAHITAQGTFIAVGAAHLPGDEGVIELLRKKGYTVTAR